MGFNPGPCLHGQGKPAGCRQRRQMTRSKKVCTEYASTCILVCTYIHTMLWVAEARKKRITRWQELTGLWRWRSSFYHAVPIPVQCFYTRFDGVCTICPWSQTTFGVKKHGVTAFCFLRYTHMPYGANDSPSPPSLRLAWSQIHSPYVYLRARASNTYTHPSMSSPR